MQLGQNPLPCGYFYCNQCLIQLTIDKWSKDPGANVFCEYCESAETLVPLYLLENCLEVHRIIKTKK